MLVIKRLREPQHYYMCLIDSENKRQSQKLLVSYSYNTDAYPYRTHSPDVKITIALMQLYSAEST